MHRYEIIETTPLIRCPVPCLHLGSTRRLDVVGWLVSQSGVKKHRNGPARGVVYFRYWSDLEPRVANSQVATPNGTVSLKNALANAIWTDTWSFRLPDRIEVAAPPTSWETVPHLRDFIWLTGFWRTQSAPLRCEPLRCIAGSDQGDAVCVICCETYTEGFRSFACQHTMHLSCLRAWIASCCEYRRPPSCPFCRSPLNQVLGRPARRAECHEIDLADEFDG
jgi:hypothetical protein